MRDPTSALAVDAGGTHTRAVTTTRSGQALGHGSSRQPGTPPPRESPMRSRRSRTQPARLGCRVSGDAPARPPSPWPASSRRSSPSSCRTGSLRSVGGGSASNTTCSASSNPEPHLIDGYALIAGTGSVAARVVGGRLEQVVGGRGWLLGDAGSGFWIGQRVARAVVAALDGQQPRDRAHGLGLQALRPDPRDRNRASLGRAEDASLGSWCRRSTPRQPVSLAALAPLAFTAHDDRPARAILVAASKALADLVDAVIVPGAARPGGRRR